MNKEFVLVIAPMLLKEPNADKDMPSIEALQEIKKDRKKLLLLLFFNDLI